MALFNDTAPPELPRVREMSPNRRRDAKLALKKFPRREFWQEVFEATKHCPVLLGKKPSRDHPNWRADFDWLIGGKEGVENAVKVLEGKYRDDTRIGPKPDAHLPGSGDRAARMHYLMTGETMRR
jgi:hypothetical protein